MFVLPLHKSQQAFAIGFVQGWEGENQIGAYQKHSLQAQHHPAPVREKGVDAPAGGQGQQLHRQGGQVAFFQEGEHVDLQYLVNHHMVHSGFQGVGHEDGGAGTDDTVVPGQHEGAGHIDHTYHNGDPGLEIDLVPDHHGGVTHLQGIDIS